MFDQATFDSAGHRAAVPWTMSISVALQATIITTAILVPLFQIEPLPPVHLVEPKPPVLSLVTGRLSYTDSSARSMLHQWVDHPQRLWEAYLSEYRALLTARGLPVPTAQRRLDPQFQML